MKITKFEDFPIWKLSLRIVKDIYDITSNKYFARDFALRDQLRRAVISINSNIVEGFEKNNNNELIRFLKISKGSVGEIRSQLYIAKTINYINNEEFKNLNDELEQLAKQIGGFVYYLTNKRKNKEFIIKK